MAQELSIRLPLAAVVLLLASAVAVHTQNKQVNKSEPARPDFSGSWLLDPSKSGRYAQVKRYEKPIVISHHDPELRITHAYELNGQPVVREFVYYTDKRGEANQTTAFVGTLSGSKFVGPEKQVTRSKTEWRDQKILTRARMRTSAGAQMLEYDLIDEWKLSADGKTLTQTSRTVFQQTDNAFFPLGVPEIKRVYKRI